MTPSKTLFYIDDFMSYIQHEKRYSVHTVMSYKNDLNDYSNYMVNAYGIHAVVEIQDIQVRSYVVNLRERKFTASSIKRHISSLKTYYKYLITAEVLQTNPLSKIPSPKVPKRLPSYLKDNETESLFEDSQYENTLMGMQEKLILEMFYVTGMRRAELIGLKESDIDLSLSQIKVLGKGNKERLLPISQGLREVLLEWIEAKHQHFDTEESKKWLFLSASGSQIYATMVYRLVRKHLTNNTTLEKKSPHVLRHTFATQLSNNGADLNAIKDLLGHASLASTQVYTHNSIEKLRKVYNDSHPRNQPPKKD